MGHFSVWNEAIRLTATLGQVSGGGYISELNILFAAGNFIFVHDGECDGLLDSHFLSFWRFPPN